MAALKQNRIIVIIPAFNEEGNIGLVIDGILAKDKSLDVAVIDDGSKDRTRDIAEKKGVFIIAHPFNMGIGSCLETGCRFAVQRGYDYALRMDADGQHNPDFIPAIIAPLTDNKADIVVGSRFLEKNESGTTACRYLGITIIALILKAMRKRQVTDPTSGFCAMNKRAFEFFSENCPDDFPEPEILVYNGEFKMMEVPITATKRYCGVSSITPLKSVYYMIKVLLSLLAHSLR